MKSDFVLFLFLFFLIKKFTNPADFFPEYFSVI